MNGLQEIEQQNSDQALNQLRQRRAAEQVGHNRKLGLGTSGTPILDRFNMLATSAPAFGIKLKVGRFGC